MSLRQVDLALPEYPGTEVIGFLYDSDDFADLGQDMIEIRLPLGITINAGWYPEGSKAGKYRVAVRGADGGPPEYRDHVEGAAELIQDLVRSFCPGASARG